jgi:hypothetical protein
MVEAGTLEDPGRSAASIDGNLGVLAGIGVFLLVIALMVGQLVADLSAPQSLLDVSLAVASLAVPLATTWWAIRTPAAASSRVGALVAAVPLMTLFIFNNVDPQIDAWWPIIPAVITAAMALALALPAAKSGAASSPLLYLAFVTAIGGGYGYLGINFADTHFDLSKGDPTPVAVLGKFTTIRQSRNSSRTVYHLSLPPWGPKTTAGSIEVDEATYDRTEIGGTVCLALHPGALGLPWFTTARSCPTTTPPGWQT